MARKPSRFAHAVLAMLALPAASIASATPAPPPLSVLTYNIHGLPPVLAGDRTRAFADIAARLRMLRARGMQPHVVVLQEAFTAAAKRVGIAAGYRYVADGPSATDRSTLPMSAADRAFADQARWWRGETEGPYEDSGLQILSDYPMVATHRTVFPRFACAGWDCLANKGALMALIRVPGQPSPVAVATVHLNSKTASGATNTRSFGAYQRQIAVLSGFLSRERPRSAPLILAGDFNVGVAAPRRADLAFGLDRVLGPGAFVRADALSHCIGRTMTAERADASEIVTHAKDWQFVLPGRSATVLPLSLSIPFGHAPDRTMLSDHIGYTIAYRFLPGRAAARA